MSIKGLEIVDEKMEELCTLLLEQPKYKELKQMIERFDADEPAIRQLEAFGETQQAMQAKERQGQALSREETEHFDREERALYGNAVIRQYLFARQEFANLQRWFGEYLGKTIEAGRLPKPKELPRITHGCGSHN